MLVCNRTTTPHMKTFLSTIPETSFIAPSSDTLAFMNDFNDNFGSELFLLMQLPWKQFGWWLLLKF